MQTTQPHSPVQPLEQVVSVVQAACERWGLAPGDTVFLNGSRVEGFENQHSDVDIWLVSPGGPEDLTSIPVFAWTEGLHINSSAYAEQHMLALAELVNGVSIDDHARVRELPLNTLVRYYRVAVAVPVVNPEGLAVLQNRFSKGHLAALLARWAHIRSVTSLRDAGALLRDGREFLAFLATRNAVDWALDSHLAANGEANPSLKWRFEKLERRFGRTSRVYTEAWSLKSLGGRSPQAYFSQCKEFVESLLPPGIDPAPVQPRLHESVRVFDIDGSRFLVQHKTHMYRLDAEAARVMELLDGARTPREIADALASQGTVDGGMEEMQRRISHVIEDLRAYGLVSTYPDGR